MGIPLELFVDGLGLKEDFKCKLCQHVLKDPKFVYNLIVGGLVCGSCVPSWLDASLSTCPEQPLTIRSPTLSFVKSLENLALHCPFQAGGCGFISSLGAMDEHKAECEFSEITRGPPNSNPSYKQIVQSGLEPEMNLSSPGNDLMVQIKKMQQDVTAYKNEAELAMKEQRKLHEIEIAAFRKAEAATTRNKMAESDRGAQLPGQGQAQLAIQKLESQLETQKLESQLKIQTQRTENYKNDAEVFLKQFLDKVRQLDQLTAETAPLKLQLVDRQQEIGHLNKELEAKALNAMNMALRVSELTAELSPVSRNHVGRDEQLAEISNCLSELVLSKDKVIDMLTKRVSELERMTGQQETYLAF